MRAGTRGTAGSRPRSRRANERNGTPVRRRVIRRGVGRSAGRRSCVVSRADVADRRTAPRTRARRDRGPRRAGSSACCPGRRASTGRSSPSLRTTRWQGTMSGTGLCPRAVPTARTARGRPISAATQPYGRTSPRGISSAFCQTSRSKSVWPRRSRSIRTRRSPSSRRAIAEARRGGSSPASCAGRPVRSRWRASNAASSSVASTSDTPRPFQATIERPDRRVEPRVQVGQTDLGEDRWAGGSGARSCAGRPWPFRCPRRWWSCGHLLALAPFRGFERRSQQGHAAVDLRLHCAFGSIEGDRQFGIA